MLSGFEIFKFFVSDHLNQTILMAPKVQGAKNVQEGDKHAANVQQMLMSASHPLLKLWSKIISQEEDFKFEAKELRYSVKLMCYSILFSTFKYP